MSEALHPLERPAPTIGGLLLLGAGVLVSVALGASIGNPTAMGTLFLGVCIGIAIQAGVLYRPFIGFMCLAGTLIFLVVFAVTDNAYLNAFDVLLPASGLAAFLGPARAATLREEAQYQGEGHAAISLATRKFTRIVIVYYLLSMVSLIPMGFRSGFDTSFEVFLGLVRNLEGLLMFPLAIWLTRSEKHIQRTFVAMLVAGGGFAAVSFYQFAVLGISRAGITWVINRPDWALESANEAGASMSIVAAVLAARNLHKPSRWTYPMLGLAVFMLLLTQSRSGLLALLTFTALSVRRVKWSQVFSVLMLIATALAFAPKDWFYRMARSLTFEKGTFEVYSIVVRFYGYQSAWRVFLDHWLFGVGMLGTRAISHLYNDLKVTRLSAESFYLETASGLGIVGVVVISILFYRLFKLGVIVKRYAPDGTLGNSIARFHFPLIAALMVGNLTATSFLGLIGTGQVALWCGLLVSAGHHALAQRPDAPARPS